MPFRGEPRMEAIRVERLDHLGLIASVINDLGLVSLIDARLKPDDQEAITPGEAVKGMILNGLGFANRPLSLSPQFFANKPLDLLFRPGVKAEMFNRFKLGRTLDEVNTYGSDLLLSEMALVGGRQEAIDQRFNHLDTTSFSLTGDYVPESDQQGHCDHPWLLERPSSGLEAGRVGTDGVSRRRRAVDEQNLGR